MLPGAEPEEQQEGVWEHNSPDTVQSVVRSSGHASTSRGRLPKVRLRTFHGEANDYLEWKREVTTTQTLYGVTDDQLGGLVYLACEAGPGKPRDILRHLEITDVCSADGLKLI